MGVSTTLETSAVVNHAQLVGKEDSTVLVPTYDWAEYFDEPFRQRALKGIKTMHHLTFTREKLGIVVVKDSINGPEREINMLEDHSWKPAADELPSIITPPGLSQERKCLTKSENFVLQNAGMRSYMITT